MRLFVGLGRRTRVNDDAPEFTERVAKLAGYKG
jgi:hypothetical protein